jgi:quercetin dioxygenase-like cupin family protein
MTTTATAESPAGAPYLAEHDPQRGITVLADAGRTDGALGVVVRDLRAGETRARYRHAAEDVAYLVLEGEVELRVGDRAWTVRPLSLVLSPRGTAHCYRALTDARIVLLAVPGGVERFFESSDVVDGALLLALAQEHRVDVVPDFLP